MTDKAEKTEKLLFPHVLAFDSSAGSGKTHQLALHFLRLLLRPASATEGGLRSQICLTFTNAAVKEMADRIIGWMKRISLTEGACLEMDQLLEPIRAGERLLAPECLLRAEGIRTIRRLFEERVLPHFDDLRVATIDSFIAMLLKAQSLRLGLAPDFELTTRVAPHIAAVMDDLFQRILEEESVRELFRSFIAEYAFLKGGDLGWSPRPFVEKEMEKIWTFLLHSAPGLAGLEEQSGRLAVFGAEKETLLRGLAADFADLADRIGKESEKKGVKINAHVLRMCGGSIRYPLDLLKPLKYPALKLNKGSDPLPAELEKDWTDFIGRSAIFLRGFSAWYYHSLTGIFSLFASTLRSRLGRTENTVLMPEIGSLIGRLLTGPGAGAGLADEIGLYLYGRYRHYLVDEFQDTDRAQWAALSALIGENLSRGGSFFAVGDNKQLVYGWRGADLSLMTEFADDFPQAPFFRSVLVENRRSDEMPVRFNNGVFDAENLGVALGAMELFRTQYRDSRQEVHGKKRDKGFVSVTLLPEPDGEEEGEDRAGLRESFLNLTDGLLRRHLKSDLCVLCRDNAEASTVVRWLLEKGVDVESSVTVDIRNNGIVAEMLSLLEFFVRPDLDAVFRHFLCGDIFRTCLPAEADEIRSWCGKVLLSPERSAPLYTGFRAAYPGLWEKYFADFFVRAGFEPAWEFTAGLLNRWKLFLLFPLYRPYLLRLLSVILAMEAESGSNLAQLPAFFRSPDAEANLFLLEGAEGTDAVKVMTVHKSKGLKFPVVIMPFVGWSPPKRESRIFRKHTDGFGIWHITGPMAEALDDLEAIREEAYTKSLVEEVNVLYVGFTRPERELHVFLPKERNWFAQVIRSSAEWQGMSQDADGRYCLGSPDPALKSPRQLPQSEDFSDFSSAVRPPDLSWTNLLKRRVAHPEELLRYDSGAARKGEWVHAVLEKAVSPALPDLEAALNTEISGFLCFPDAFDAELIEEIRLILRQAADSSYFVSLMTPSAGSEVRTEAEVCDTYGNLFRIDRLVLTEKEALIVDFKTGQDCSADEDHRKQVKRYAEIVSGIWPHLNVRAVLCYLSPRNVRLEEVV